MSRLLFGARFRLMILLSACLAASVHASPEIPFPRDGWVSWSVATVPAPAWCCFDWLGSSVKPEVCALDKDSHGYGSKDRDEPVSEMRIYARFKAGQLDRLRTLAASCPVKTNSPIRTLDAISAEDSLDWLKNVVSPRTGLSDDALAAMAVHYGNGAAAALAGVAKLDPSKKNRQQAMFWATQVRGEEGLQMTLPYLFDDPDADIREQAAFAVSQTGSPSAVTALIRQGRVDASTRVRAQAWFWLSRTGSAQTETAIFEALNKEPSQKVREEAVFALSQLPEPRNVAALVRVAEDQAQHDPVRKQALFWLGQSESDEALAYLERLLGR